MKEMVTNMGLEGQLLF